MSDGYEERELAPGIFVTDFRYPPTNRPTPTPAAQAKSGNIATAAAPVMPHPSSADSDINQLLFDLAQLENSLSHLYRSQVELMEAYDATQDTEFKQAFEENEAVLARMEDRKSELQALIDEMTRGPPTSHVLESAGGEGKREQMLDESETNAGGGDDDEHGLSL